MWGDRIELSSIIPIQLLTTAAGASSDNSCPIPHFDCESASRYFSDGGVHRTWGCGGVIALKISGSSILSTPGRRERNFHLIPVIEKKWIFSLHSRNDTSSPDLCPGVRVARRCSCVCSRTVPHRYLTKIPEMTFASELDTGLEVMPCIPMLDPEPGM